MPISMFCILHWTYTGYLISHVILEVKNPSYLAGTRISLAWITGFHWYGIQLGISNGFYMGPISLHISRVIFRSYLKIQVI